ncbi:MAG: chemotaxis protein MotA [Alteromonadaceae bacterium]|jgi:chemotaxis protein MotA
MDKGSGFGLALLVVAIIGGIIASGVPMVSFINLPSIFIVVVGTFGAVMISHRINVFFDALYNIRHAFKLPNTHLPDTIDKLVELAEMARSGGYLALEAVEVEDPFMTKATHLLIDGHTSEALEVTLTKEIYLTKERNTASVKVLNSFTETAPSMGMVGTLIGLVGMLLTMDDPKTIGLSMSVALLTTLYGALIAYGITGPLAKKLGDLSNETRLHQSLIKDAFIRIANGDNPKAIFEFLQSYLDHSKRRPPLSATELAAKVSNNESKNS